MSELLYTVHVQHPNGSDTAAFGPGDTVPGWALKQIAPYCFEDGDNSKYRDPGTRRWP